MQLCFIETDDLNLHVSVEDVEARETESEASEGPYFDSCLTADQMAGPAGLDDLIAAMRDLITLQGQQLAQTTLLQQQATAQMHQAGFGPGLPGSEGRPGPQIGVTKISPTLPIFDGSGDADDHMDLFLGIANAKGWNDAQKKLHFYKTLTKTGLTWYMRNATVIQMGDWTNEYVMFLDYFRAPTYKADRQVLAMLQKQGEKESIRDFANEKIRLWKRVNPGIEELELVTHIRLGLRPEFYARFGGARMSTLKKLLESGRAVEDVEKLEAEAEVKLPVKDPDPTPESSKLEGLQPKAPDVNTGAKSKIRKAV